MRNCLVQNADYALAMTGIKKNCVAVNSKTEILDLYAIMCFCYLINVSAGKGAESNKN